MKTSDFKVALGDLAKTGVNTTNYVIYAKEFYEYLLAINSKHNAFTKLVDLAAITEYFRKFTQNEIHGPLAGKLIGVKDVFHGVHGDTASCMSNMQKLTLTASSYVVSQLQQKGALIFASCNGDEFSCGSFGDHSKYGPIYSIWNHEKYAGGSSAGGAVSSALVSYVDIGTDTGGSCRLPANFNGIYGFKVTRGGISREGMCEYASPYDTVGIMSSDPNQIELVWQQLKGFQKGDFATVNFKEEPAKHIALQIVEKYADYTLEAHHVLPKLHRMVGEHYALTNSEISLSRKLISSVYSTISSSYMFSALRRFDYKTHKANTNPRDEMLGQLKRKVMIGAAATIKDGLYAQAVKYEACIKNLIKPILKNGLLAFISSSEEYTPLVEADYFLANICGTPAISIPIQSDQNTVISMNVMAEAHHEADLFKLAKLCFEANAAHHTQLAHKKKLT